jgi:hypothetical protein
MSLCIIFNQDDTIDIRFTVLNSGYCAFTHKAGIHAKAILNNPSTYEILKPEDFGLTRYVSIGYASSSIFMRFSNLVPFCGMSGTV